MSEHVPEPTDAHQRAESPIRGDLSERATEPHQPQPSRNYAAAIYGSVLAATVAVSSGDLRAPGVLALLLIVSGVVFWLAHVYAATVASVHGGWQPGAIKAGLRHEWPVAFAAIPPAIAAVIGGSLPMVTATEGAWAALIVAIVEQQIWGYVAIRKARLSGPGLAKTMLLNLGIGLIVVAMKLAVAH